MGLRGFHSIVILAVLLFIGCSAAEVTVVPDASRVTVETRSPEGAYQQLGAITAQHGGGCGLYGSRGDYEGAYTKLRNKAAALGADYVQIIKVTAPHLEGACMVQAFVIDGIAYKKATRVDSPQTAPEPKKLTASFGTGFLIRPDGILATAYHVVEGATRIEVKCPGMEATTATPEVTAPSNDLAVLRMVPSNLPYLPMAKPRSVKLGDRVFTIGFQWLPFSAQMPNSLMERSRACQDPAARPASSRSQCLFSPVIQVDLCLTMREKSWE